MPTRELQNLTPMDHQTFCFGKFLLCSSSVLQFLQIFLPSGNLTSGLPKIVYLTQGQAISLSEFLANQKHLIRKKDSLNFQTPVDLPPGPP